MKPHVLFNLLLQFLLAGLLVSCLDTADTKLRNAGNSQPGTATDADQTVPTASTPNPSTTQTTPSPSTDQTPTAPECLTLALFDGDDDDGGGDDDDGGGSDDDDGADDDDVGSSNPPPRPTPTPTPTPTPDRCKPSDTSNDQTPTPTPTPTTLSFADDIAPILSRSCVSSNCHSSQRPRDGVDTETLEGTKRSFGRSLRSIKRGSMPIRGFPDLSAEEIQMLELWQKQGFQP